MFIKNIKLYIINELFAIFNISRNENEFNVLLRNNITFN